MIENYIGWKSNVNKIILASSTINTGENATISENLEAGGKRTELKGGYIPEKYNINMEFECDELTTPTKSEFQLFTEWYKYKHKYGSVPFEFPKILYSPQSGITVLDNSYNNTAVEYYKITSAVQGQKSGSKIQVNMTWETVYGGITQIEDEDAAVNGISKATRDYMEISFSSVADTEPTSDLFTVYIDDTKVTKTGFYYDGNGTVRIYYAGAVIDTESHTVTFAMNSYGNTTIAKDTFSSEIPAQNGD